MQVTALGRVGVVDAYAAPIFQRKLIASSGNDFKVMWNEPVNATTGAETETEQMYPLPVYGTCNIAGCEDAAGTGPCDIAVET